ncbi:MAG: hypothetical protein H8E66_04775 [Planctomycetes bacterium]|nr:hypothetical protein [Planctomycetota bacterium]
MSAQDNTFIDAYGLELSDELEATYAQPTRQAAEPSRAESRVDDTDQQKRSYRFDAAARRRVLRGPHFDMRSVAPPAENAATGWDTIDTNVIDVGAAWAPLPIAVQPEFTEEPSLELAAQVEEPSEADDASELVAPSATQPAVVATDSEETDTPEQQTVAEIEVPATSAMLPAAESTETFAPVWEVDRFSWPEDIEQLFKAQSEYFDYAGKKLVAASREGLKILAITSTRSREGSTTLALCLARAAASAGAKVGLLDGSFVHSELGEKLGVDFASGWQSAAAFEQPLSEAAISGLEEGITLFPSAGAPVADVTSLEDDRVGQLFRAAATSCDLLIIDAGTADLGNNVKTLDAAMVVRDIRSTSEEETLTVASAFRDCGVKAVGIAENFGSSQANRAAA